MRTTKKIKTNWVQYDEKHLINTEIGMIVTKETDLDNIKPINVISFEKLYKE